MYILFFIGLGKIRKWFCLLLENIFRVVFWNGYNNNMVNVISVWDRNKNWIELGLDIDMFDVCLVK